jgi:hypothetical protein
MFLMLCPAQRNTETEAAGAVAEGCPQHATHPTIAWQNALMCDYARKKTTVAASGRSSGMSQMRARRRIIDVWRRWH